MTRSHLSRRWLVQLILDIIATSDSVSSVERLVMGTLSDPQKPENAEYVIQSNRLEDILQCSENVSQRIVVTSATYPYHVEWINSVWSKACGWRSDEILGTLNLMSGELLQTYRR